MQQDIQWGARQMPEEQKERLRQFLASRGEIAAGGRMVLRGAGRPARGGPRFWLAVAPPWWGASGKPMGRMAGKVTPASRWAATKAERARKSPTAPSADAIRSGTASE